MNSQRSSRILGVLAAAALAAAACSSDSGPEPFEGTATEKAAEVVRRAEAAGLTVADVETIKSLHGEDGGSTCDHSREERTRLDAIGDALFDEVPGADELTNIIISVYCPHLL